MRFFYPRSRTMRITRLRQHAERGILGYRTAGEHVLAHWFPVAEVCTKSTLLSGILDTDCGVQLLTSPFRPLHPNGWTSEVRERAPVCL